MKRISVLAIVLFGLTLFCVPMKAQAAPRSVGLTWTPPGDSTATTTYHIYRASAACANGVAVSTLTTLSFVRLDGATSAQSAPNYTDATVGVGSFCYYVTAVTNGTESGPSLTAGATVAPLAPTALAAKAN